MQLIVAEKPSVARDLARVLGVRAARRARVRGRARDHVVHRPPRRARRAGGVRRPRGRRGGSTRCRCCRRRSGCARRKHARAQLRAVARAAARSAVHGDRERVRRRPRGRADLPLRLPVRAGRACRCAAVDLVADRRGDPARVRGAAAGPARRAGGRGALALGGRLAGRHERDARGHGARRGGTRAATRSAACRRRRSRWSSRASSAIRAFVPRDYWEVRGRSRGAR